ncbi:MAG TPA: glycoside hydrolase family 38 C-terminal domain-containing protein [Granulicella sp.]
MSCPLHGQRTQSPQNAGSAVQFTPDENKVLDKLDSLAMLPDGAWRYHAGDMPHGELPSLDDSSWQQVSGKFKADKGAVWFRRVIEVPKTLQGYDLTGAQIDFRFSAGNSVTEILYFNGRRVALGEDLESVQLFNDAKPGDKILVAVKLLPTVDEKTFDHVDMPITFAANRPNPRDLQKELLSAASLLPALDPKGGDEKVLKQALGEVDLHALEQADQVAFDKSLRQSETTLSSLRPLFQQATFLLAGNSHIDAAWLWPWTETVDAVKRTFGTAAQLMSEYPNYTYTQSAAVYSQWMAEKYPQLNDQIRQRIQEGRWELVGGMWLEPDLNMPDGESLVRQLLVGQATFNKLYGKTTRIGWNPDSFGYNWQLPQIYKRSGIDYFVTQKMDWNDTNKLPLKLFWWESPDGSKVLTYFPHSYANRNLDPVRLSKDFASATRFSPGMTQMMDLYGVGDHGGGPTRGMLDEGQHWMQPDKVMAHEEFGTAQGYFTSIEKKLGAASPMWNYQTMAKGDTSLPTPATGEISIPTWKDELYLEYHRGVFTTQAQHKKNMRDSEEWLLDAEKYASLAWLGNKSYPQNELTEAWKLTLFNQFHDLAAGSGIGIIYKDAQKDYDQVRWATNEISKNSLAALSAQVNTQSGNGTPVLVFNSLAWQRGGIAEASIQLPGSSTAEGITLLDAKGQVVPSQVLKHDAKTNTYEVMLHLQQTPSLGYTVLHAVPGKRAFATDLKSSGTTIENTFLRIAVDPQTGCITSLFDKKNQFETIAKGGCGNELQAFPDNPKRYDAWNIDPGTLDVAPELLHQVASVKLVQEPLRTSIRIERTWKNSKFVQEIALYTGEDHAVVSNDFDWHETHMLLKASFPLAAGSDRATYEIPYGTIERPTTRNNSFEKAMFEVPALRWADLGNEAHGFSLLNNSKYGYDAVGNQLRLTLLRSPVSPDPDADRGPHHFIYGLYPHGGNWRQALTVRHGYEFNYTLKAAQAEAHEGSLPAEHSFAGISDPNVVLTAMKKAEDGNGLIFRFYEWAGKAATVTLNVPPGASSAIMVNLMEKPTEETIPVSGNAVAVPVTPFEIQTVRVNYPSERP